MNARHPEIPNPQANAENPSTPAAVTAAQKTVAERVDITTQRAYNEKSSNNSTEANPNLMNANPEANNTLHHNAESRLEQIQALLKNMDAALARGEDPKSLAEDIKALERNGVTLDAKTMMADVKAMRQQLKNLQAVLDWDSSSPESTCAALSALEALSKTAPAEALAELFTEFATTFYKNTTIGLESLQKAWSSMSPTEQIAYLKETVAGLPNKLVMFLESANPVFFALGKFGIAQGAMQEWLQENGRTLETLNRDDLAYMILTGILPTSEEVISELEKMMTPEQYKTVADKAIGFGMLLSKAGPTAEIGGFVTLSAGAARAGMTLQEAFYKACHRVRAQRRENLAQNPVHHVQTQEEVAAMRVVDPLNSLPEAANNTDNFTDTSNQQNQMAA